MLTTIAWLLCWTSTAAAQDSPNAGEIKTEQRTFESKTGETISYEIGTIFVPENRSDPSTRVIGVGFARFPAANQPLVAPPVFRLPGGPGGSLVMRMKDPRRIERTFPEMMQFRQFTDVVYVDQRGYSEHGDVLMENFSPPARKADAPITEEDRVAAFQEFARSIAKRYAEREIDLRGYTVKECAQDVVDLGRALGYEKISLNGTSFGSQWSFAVMRMHPDYVARALLSGVEPLNHGYDMPSHVFAAVQRMWRAVEADPRFQPYLPEGGMAEAARVVIERLEREPQRLLQTKRATGEKVTLATFGPQDFPWSNASLILELYHGRTQPWQQLVFRSLMVRRARIRLIGPLIDTSLGVTPERGYLLWNDPATRYVGRGFAMYMKTAKIWPSPDVGDDFRTPVLCDIPVVFAHGDWDLKTPIENAYEIAPFFPNSRLIVAHRGGHGVLEPIHREHPDVWSELVEFLRTGDLINIPARVTLRASRRFSPPTFELSDENDKPSDSDADGK